MRPGFQPRSGLGQKRMARAAIRAAVWVLCACVAFVLSFGSRTASATENGDSPDAQPKPAKLKVSGGGLFKDRRLRNTILQLSPGKARPAVWGANFVEDAALVLRNTLQAEGYLNAQVEVEIEDSSGASSQWVWGPNSDAVLPSDLSARRVRFRLRKGILFYYASWKVTGLSQLPAKEARGYFYKSDFLLGTRTSKRFSQDRFRSSMDGLRRALRTKGYQDAVVNAGRLDIDRETGRVEVELEVVEGARHVVESIKIAKRWQADAPLMWEEEFATNQAFSLSWVQDMKQVLQTAEYARGYADAEVDFQPVPLSASSNEVQLRIDAEIRRGPLVGLGDTRFEGLKKTRLSMLKRRIQLEGPYLNRLEVDETRERIARLGVFQYVDARFEPAQGPVRDVVYDLDEGPIVDFHLLFGFGSYDLAFGGFELDQYNLFGLAHNSRLRAVQSFKSTTADYTYTIPEFLAPDLSLFATAQGLQREEVSFDREELTLSVGARKAFHRSGNQVGLRYAYEFLDARLAPEGATQDTPDEVAAFILDAQRERRDNPLLPRQGYRLFGSIELADPSLGGESEYERFDWSVSYHRPLGGGRFVHAGLSQGIVFSRNPDTDLPFNKRYFPGGENSVRGYQRGEASPLNADGEEIGAESALEWTFELEQALTAAWSLVGFVDGVCFGERVDRDPFETVLWSAGGGLRWNTVIGPVRVEYGHNINPRDEDPSGTLHFSIGYPF